ncbi:MAG: TolC family protein [Candidatus Aminicenantes bacterium]|nr:TolC family protein [Candidatus Aminicenantes bacterium]
MRHRILISAVALLAVSILPARAAREEDVLKLSLQECIQKTLKNNLGLAAEILSPKIAEADLAQANERFIPTLAFSYSRQDNMSASYSFLDAAGAAVSTLQNSYSSQLSQTLPTGGSLSMSLDGGKSDTTRQFQTINPRFSSTLRFNFSQPLLKDFGWKISRRNIILARNNRDASEYGLSETMEEYVYRAKSAYWSLVYTRENLDVRRKSLILAQELLEQNKAEVEAGTLPPIEILTAQADVSTREADILEAEAAVRNSEDLLKTLINLQAENSQANLVHIEPTDSPSVSKPQVSLDEALHEAYENRPDLQATRVRLGSSEFNLAYARNQLFPDLRLTASYWSPGISGTQILYENGNALSGKIIGVVPAGGDQAMKDAFAFKYKNWSVGLSLSLPLGAIFSRAEVASANLELEQARLRLQNQEQQIFLEIRTAVRMVETNYLRIQAYRVARENAAKKLEAEQEKLKVGLSTNYFILQYQRDLATAMINELKSIVDYNVSLAALYRAQGRGLEMERGSLPEDNPGQTAFEKRP